MKRVNILIQRSMILAALVFFFACTKDDAKMDYGFTKIYMPQSVIRSGGTNNQYPVPTGTDSSTWNYSIDKAKGKLNITMGASLSGPGVGAYGVDIKVNNDTIQKLFNAKLLDPATNIIMPTSMFTIPANLEVAQGKRSGFFTLSIDYALLKSAPYRNKFLLVSIGFSNARTYELNAALSSAIVVVDVSKIP